MCVFFFCCFNSYGFRLHFLNATYPASGLWPPRDLSFVINIAISNETIAVRNDLLWVPSFEQNQTRNKNQFQGNTESRGLKAGNRNKTICNGIMFRLNCRRNKLWSNWITACAVASMRRTVDGGYCFVRSDVTTINLFTADANSAMHNFWIVCSLE